MADSFLYGTIEYTDEVGDSLDVILGNFEGLDEQLGIVTDYIEIVDQIATWDIDTYSLDIVNNITATRVYNAVYNDLADFQALADTLTYGKCYVDTKNGAKIATKRCQLGVIGVASDTYGFCLGKAKTEKIVPIALAGWVLAYVDKEYATGIPLTNDANGNLTEMTVEEKRDYPERLLATYKKPESAKVWGPPKAQIKVNGRHWVKVK
jgi:hypothetical protein